MRQSTGAAPCCSSSAFACENGRDPKKPREADSGLGWGLAIWGTSPSRGIRDWAIAAPQDRDQRAAAGHQRAQRLLGEILPAAPTMRRGLARRHGEHPVQQQHPLVLPRGEIAVGGAGDAQIALELGEDVRQRTG